MATYKIQQPKPMLVLSGNDLTDLDKKIKAIEKDFSVKEVDIIFKEERLLYNQIHNSEDAYKFVREIIGDGIEIQEHFVVLYVNHSHKIIGYYKHSKGSISSTVADAELIIAVALKILTTGIILAHNHPSGNMKPSEPDRDMTKKIQNAAKFFDIQVLDHLIVTKTDYYSFADNSLMGIEQGKGKGKTDSQLENQLREEILHQLKKVTQANSPNIWEKIQTPEGYKRIEEQIIHRVIYMQLVPAAIIPQMEVEMS